MAKGFKSASNLDVEANNELLRAQAEQLRKEQEEAKKKASSSNTKAPVAAGLNVLIVIPSYNQEQTNFIRLTHFHYFPFTHVCSRPAPIFDPDDPNLILADKRFQFAGDSRTPAFSCRQCVSGWAVIESYIKENGIALKDVSRNVAESQYYSDNKASIQGIYQALNVSGFFFLEKGKNIPTLNKELYEKWFTIFMDVVIDKVEAPEDMPKDLKVQAEAGLQIMLGNQNLVKEIKKAIYTKYEEAEEYPLNSPSKFLISINQTKDTSSKFQTKDGEKEANAYSVSCFNTSIASGKNGPKWEVPDRFFDFVEEFAEDIYNINYEGDRIEDKALAFQPLNDEELALLCKKYGVDIINNKLCAKANAKKSEDVESEGSSNPSDKPSSSYKSGDHFDDSDSDEDDDELLAAAKKRSSNKK